MYDARKAPLMGKRQLENPESHQQKKKRCSRPAPLASQPDHKSAAPMAHKKGTVPQPFNLSSRSAFREAQLARFKEDEESRRRRLETFAPRINEKRPGVRLHVGPAKKQVCEDPRKKETRQDPDMDAPTTKAAVSAAPSRLPLSMITNTIKGSSPRKAPPLPTGPTGRPSTRPRPSPAALAAVAQGGPPFTSRPSMGPPRAGIDNGQPATARCSTLAGKSAPTGASRRASNAGAAHAALRGRPWPGAIPSGTAAPPGVVAQLAKTAPSRLATRRATAGPQHHRPPVPPPPPDGAGSARPAAVAKERPTAKVVTFEGSVPLEDGPQRSSSAPVTSQSPSHDVGAFDGEDDESVKNFGPGGYCRIVKDDTFCDGRYTAIHQLGEGKYSTVWLMHDRDGPHPGFSHFVAIKVGRATSSDLPEDIKQESNLLEYINTKFDPSDLKCLATVTSSFVHEGPHGLHACMVFKVLGSQLLRLIYERNDAHRQGLPLDTAGMVNIFRCILQGAAAFHKHNIVHTDLKPENILLAIPDPEVVEQMKTFTREHNLPEPYLDRRPQASVTPLRHSCTSSPKGVFTQRSSSVDPLAFWGGRSPHAALRAADERAAAAGGGGPPIGRSTMAAPRPVEEEPGGLPAVPSITAEGFTAALALGAEPEGPVPNESPVEVESPPARSFVCARRGSLAAPVDSPDLTAAQSPPAHLRLRPAPPMDSPPPALLPWTAEGVTQDTGPKTPKTGTPLRSHPDQPPTAPDQGRGTDTLISDFGLAMVLEHGHVLAPPGVSLYPQDHVVSNHTHGMVIQTREYRAPEILLGQDFNVKIDIYSIACIMVELITGDYLWDPKNTVPRRQRQSEQEIDREHFQHMVAVLGADDFPKLQARRACYKARFFLPNGDLRVPPARRRKPKSRPLGLVLASHVPEPLRSELAYLLERMMAFHPNDRWTAAQCLEYLERPAFSTPAPAPEGRVLGSSVAT